MNTFSGNLFKTYDEIRFANAEYVIKTITLLMYQFIFTFGAIISVASSTVITTFLQNNLWLSWWSFIGALGTIIYIFFGATKRTELQLAIFTFFETLFVCCFTTLFGRECVMMAIFCTSGITFGLIIYALTTKINYTPMMNVLYSCLSTLLFMMILNMFLKNNILYTIEAYVGILLFLCYIVVDVQYFLQDRSRHLRFYKEDLHIIAAINIYLDVINLFIRLLKLYAENKKYNKKRY
jgi:hypothetical protein